MKLAYTGRGIRSAWHSGQSKTVEFNAFLYELEMDNGQLIEVAVDPAVGDENAARARVNQITKPIGQIPLMLREHVAVVAVHDGPGRATASANGRISMYAGGFDDLIAKGWMEELFIHEATHTSLDKFLYRDPEYNAAKSTDANFVSTYARDNPNSEDIAESIVPYLAVRYKADRISADMDRKIRASMGERIKFFDELKLDVYPTLNTSKSMRAEMTSPLTNTTLQGNTVTFAWSKPSSATAYDLLLGSMGAGSTDIRASSVVTANQITVNTLPSDGKRVYARLWTQNNGNWRYDDLIYYGFDPSKTKADIQKPQPGSYLASSSIKFVWDRPVGVTNFDIVMGTNGAGSDNVRASNPFNQTEFTLNGLPKEGGELYVRLWAYKTQWEYQDYVYTAASDADRADLLAPAAGTKLTSSSVTFSWLKPLNASRYDLLVGTTGAGSTDIRASKILSEGEVTVTNMPTDGRKIYVRLWTQKNGEWRLRDYVFN